MTNGKVKWFNNGRGYGFVIDENGHDIFVHYTVIAQDGFKTLREGQKVRYEKAKGPKGYHATVVEPEPAYRP